MLSRVGVLPVVLCATVYAATSAAQSYTDWSVVPSGTFGGLYSGDTYTVDLNNDGVADLVTNEVYDYGRLQPYFAVFISNGDGTFQSPVRYAYSPSSIFGGSAPYNVSMAFGDFNSDGNVDVAMPADNHTIAIYLGKGDGTFVDPWYSVVDLPSSQYIPTSDPAPDGHPAIVAADFNHDGHLDLAVVGKNTDQSGETVYVLPGQGNGLFSSTVPVLNVANYNIDATKLLTGDFDYDTNADLAVEVIAGPNNSASTAVHVLYGDGNFGFDDTIPITETGYIDQLTAGDLNSDGKSDLYSVKAGIQTWYGQWDRTFASYVQTLPGAVYISSTQPMADFNNDGLKDLVVAANGSFLVFLLATPSPGQFDLQTWNVPPYLSAGVGGSGVYSMPVAGNFKRNDEKPDFAYIGMTGPQISSIDASIPYVGLNATVGQLWSNCDYPAASRGINLCSPALQSDSTVNFNATAHSLGNLRKIELWVDGAKLGEQYNTWEGKRVFQLELEPERRHAPGNLLRG